MGKVETYSSLEEKGEFFEQKNIKTKDEFEKVLCLYEKNADNNLIYRGCKKAHYKLYNKAQREWINKDLSDHGFSFVDFILMLIDNAKRWQGDLLKKFFSASGQPVNDLLVLGFLQHYGAPTTLLDWTYSFNNSLFFAIDGLKNLASENEIENYFSVYIINNEICKITDHIITLKDLSEAFSLQSSQRSEFRENYQEILTLAENLNYEDLESQAIALLRGYQENGITHKVEWYSFNFFYNQQNLNIINQQGVFLINSNPDLPLEKFFQSKTGPFLPKWNKYPKITCLNIHKSLLKYVKSYLSKQTPFPINKEFIYPKEETIASKAFEQILNFDYKNNE